MLLVVETDEYIEHTREGRSSNKETNNEDQHDKEGRVLKAHDALDGFFSNALKENKTELSDSHSHTLNSRK